MSLRRQKMGKQIPWTLEELQAGLEHFYKEHGHYPSATEVDTYPYLPSARSIERRFGGLIELRKQLGAGSQDLRTGDHSARRAHTINARAHAVERDVYDYLVKRFGKAFVHREYFFTDDHRTRADFFVYDRQDGFCIDVFYAGSVRNITGCLNIKLNKYSGTGHLLPYPVIFLHMNPDISQGRLDQLIASKDKKLLANQYLMDWETFRKFCENRNPLQLLQKETLQRVAGGNVTKNRTIEI